jgi:hypothetical protein
VQDGWDGHGADHIGPTLPYDWHLGAVQRLVTAKEGSSMSRIRLVGSSAAVLALLALPAGSSAAGMKCAKTAVVKSGKIAKIQQITRDEQGKPLVDKAPTVKTLRRSTYFVAVDPSTIMMQGSRFTVGDGAVFSLSCWGHSAKEGAKYPMLDIGAGTATVTARDGRSVGLTSDESLLDNFADKNMTFSLTRTPEGDPSLEDIITGGPGLLAFGTTVAKKTAGDGFINLTPYVGTKPGTCRQAKGGKLTSTGRDARGFLKGSATYTGFASSSPR